MGSGDGRVVIAAAEQGMVGLNFMIDSQPIICDTFFVRRRNAPYFGRQCRQGLQRGTQHIIRTQHIIHTLVPTRAQNFHLILGAQVASGCEINRWLVWYSRARSLLRGTWGKTDFHCRNLWREDLSSYDYVILFGAKDATSFMADIEVGWQLK